VCLLSPCQKAPNVGGHPRPPDALGLGLAYVGFATNFAADALLTAKLASLGIEVLNFTDALQRAKTG